MAARQSATACPVARALRSRQAVQPQPAAALPHRQTDLIRWGPLTVKRQVNGEAGKAGSAGEPVSEPVDERGLLVHAAAVPEQYQRPPPGRALGQPQERGNVLARARHRERHFPYARAALWC